MSKLEYNLTSKSLTLRGSNGKVLGTWRAVSGPHGKGALPRGNYVVKNPNGNNLHEGLAAGFNMPSGLGFFIPLYAPSSLLKGRKGFGIHPDGGTPGTQGCIGIKRHALDFWNTYIQYRPTRLQVK
ncbi:MAG: L,D-transpeptidase [Sulfurovum sp.]|nr:L,D-transpeptidase [Sulfurovum sp.]